MSNYYDKDTEKSIVSQENISNYLDSGGDPLAIFLPRKKIASKIVGRFELYDMIKGNSFKKETLSIRERFTDEIKEGFTNGKKTYQDNKFIVLCTTNFTGYVDLSQGAKLPNTHSGIINLDIDENTPEELRHFREIVLPKIVFIEAAITSVSGNVTGAMSINTKIQIPSDYKAFKRSAAFKMIKKGIKKGLFSGDISRRGNWIDTLHKTYHYVITYLFKQLSTPIKIGSAKDLKRTRYLTHDPNIYVNKNASQFDLSELAKNLHFAIEAVKKEAPVNHLEKFTTNINTSDSFVFAEQYALTKEGECVDGNKHLFAKSYAIACNLLGVEHDTAYAAFIDKFGFEVTSNAFSYPYQKYKNSFGAWEHKVRKKTISHLRLKFNEYLSECFERDLSSIEHFISQHKQMYFHAPTGGGKSYASNLHLIPLLEKLYPNHDILFLTPLEILTKEFAGKFDGFTAIVGGDDYENAKTVDLYKNKYLCTFKQAGELLKRLREKNGNLEKVILVVDEMHEFINSAYQRIAHLRLYLEEAKKVIGLTATPHDFVFQDIYNFRKIECSRATNPVLNIDINTFGKGIDPMTAIIQEAKSRFSNNSKYKAIIFVDSRRLVDSTAKALNMSGAKAVAVHSKLPKSVTEKCTTIQSIINKGEFGEDVNFIVTTRKLALGISIITGGIDIFYYAKSGRDFMNFRQSIARLRGYEFVNVSVFFSEQIEGFQRKYFSKRRFERDKARLQKICAAKNLIREIESCKIELRTPNNINNALLQCIAFCEDRGYFVDEPQLLYRQYEQIVLCMPNEAFIEDIKSLPNANVIIRSSAGAEEEEKESFQEIKQAQKEETKQAAEMIKELFVDEFDNLVFFAYKNTQSETLKRTLKGAATRINDRSYENDNEVRYEYGSFEYAYADFVLKNLPEVENYLNRYFKFKLDFNDTIEESEIVRMIFKSRYHYGHHYKQLAKLTLLESLNNEVEANHTNYLNFEIAQFDQRIINAVDKAIESAGGNRLLKGDVLALVKDISVRGLKEHLTRTNIKNYLSYFYDVDVKRKRCGNGEFENYLIFEGKYLLSEIATFKTPKVIKHQSSIIRKQKLMFDHPNNITALGKVPIL